MHSGQRDKLQKQADWQLIGSARVCLPVCSPSSAVSSAARVRAEKPPPPPAPDWVSLGREFPNTSASSMNTTAGARALAAAKMPWVDNGCQQAIGRSCGCVGDASAANGPLQAAMTGCWQLHNWECKSPGWCAACTLLALWVPVQVQFSTCKWYQGCVLETRSLQNPSPPSASPGRLQIHLGLGQRTAYPCSWSSSPGLTGKGQGGSAHADLDAGLTVAVELGDNLRPLQQQQRGSSISRSGHCQLGLAGAWGSP